MSTPTDTPPDVDLTSPEFVSDPAARFAEVRERAPVVRGTLFAGMPVWLVTRYEDVRMVLSDPRFANSSLSVPGNTRNVRAEMLTQMGLPKEYVPYITETVLDYDPPDHTRLRRLVTRAFSMRRVNALRPRVEELTADLLDALPDHAEDGVVDLVEHFAYPLPITVICEMVGVPEEDRPDWKQWSHALMQIQDTKRGEWALGEMIPHIKQMLAERRAAPQDYLLDALIQVRDEDDDKLTESELVTWVLTLVIAGHETTAHLISNGTLALLTHPDQLARLREDPERLPAAVHEIMRWCGPVHMTRPRYATEDLTLGGVQIRAGDMVEAVVVSSNHDPRYFTDPERFDIDRELPGRGEQHIGFGAGPHYCLGAALARQEGEVAFGAIFDHYPNLALAVPQADLEWHQLPTMRRLKRLPLRL